MKKTASVLGITTLLSCCAGEKTVDVDAYWKKEVCLSSSQQIIGDLDDFFAEGKISRALEELPLQRDTVGYYIGKHLLSYPGIACTTEQLYDNGYLLQKIEGSSSEFYRLVIERLPEV